MSSSDSEGMSVSTLSKADKKARKEEKRARKAEKEAKRQRKEEKRRKRARDDGDGEGDESRKDDEDDDKAAKKKRKAEKKARKEAKKEKASASSDVDEQPKAGSSSTQPAPAAMKPSTSATTFSSRARQQTPSHNPFAPTTSPAPRGMTPFFPNRPPPPPGVAAAGPSSSSTTLDPRDFPPGLDLSAINANLARGASSSSSSSSSAAPRRITTAAFEAAITSSSSNKTPRIRAQASKKGESASSGGESLQKSREGTIEDARGLSQAQILAHKLYQPHQLKWLEEAGMLTTLRKGVFTDTEREAMQDAFSSFWKKHKMTFSQGQEVLGSRDHKGQADLYAQMTSAVTESVPGRSQRAVRRYVRETFHPNARKGQWTDKDIMTLTGAYKEVGPNWTAIAQRVGRIARDCRTRWRDHGGEDQRLVGDGTVPGVKGETSTGKLSGVGAATTSDAGASTSASATASASTSTSTTASWTSAEIKELLIAVPEVCAQLNVDLSSGGLPSWSVVSARIKTKPASSCQRKWDEIRIARLKGRSDEDIIANKRTGREDSYLGARDNKRLVERLEEGGWEDEKEIDWGKVMDEDALVFGKNELSKAWKRLKDRGVAGSDGKKGKGKKDDTSNKQPTAKKPTFKELLAQLKPIVDEEHAKWLRAEEEKQRNGGAKKRKKRGAEESRSPSGSPSKRPKRAMGTGAVDLGDEIGSDEDW